jgi:hypothetical protein
MSGNIIQTIGTASDEKITKGGQDYRGVADVESYLVLKEILELQKELLEFLKQQFDQE